MTEARALVKGTSTLALVGAAAIALSVITNKLIAVYAGAEGVGLMGIYRNLGAWVMGGLALGYHTILMQRASLCRADEETRELLEVSGLLLLGQTAVIILISAAAAGAIARFLFAEASASAVAEVRIVLAMAWVNLILQTALAVIRGKADIKAIAAVQFSTSIATLLVILPLISWGRKGLAFNTASGSVVGAVVGFFYLWRRYRPKLCNVARPARFNALRAWAPSSFLLSLQSLGLMGGMVVVQAAVSKHYGLAPLGNINAAWLILDTLIMIIMSSARTQLLSSLGNSDDAAKAALVSSTLTLLLAASAVAGLAVIFLGKLAMVVLFSRQFRIAAPLLAVVSVSLVGQAFGWSYNTVLLHKDDTAFFVGLDLFWTLLFVAGALACIRSGFPIVSVAWAYSASYGVYGAVYALVAVRRHGRGLLSVKNFSLACACQGILLIAALLVNR